MKLCLVLTDEQRALRFAMSKKKRKRGGVVGQEAEEPELQARKGLGSSFPHETSPHQPPSPRISYKKSPRLSPNKLLGVKFTL